MGFEGFWVFWGGVTACRSRSVAHPPLWQQCGAVRSVSRVLVVAHSSNV